MSKDLEKLRVLVVDNDLPNLNLLRFLLEDEGYEVMAARNISVARQILEGARDHLIGLVILDLTPPGADGLDFCREIREYEESLPIILMSSKGGSMLQAEGLRMGADDFVAKPFDPTELLARVGAVLRRARPSGGVGESQPVLRMGEVELDAARLKVRTGPGRESDLTPTETKLLHCLMRNAGRVLTKDALISQVWDYEGSNSSLDVYIRRLRQKVETEPSNPRYIRTVRGAGYIFQVERSNLRRISSGR